MPIHDYVCAKCGHKMEVMHSVHGNGPTACPQCGGPMKKTFAPPAVHFKGTGWARKDRSGGDRADRTAAKESGSGSGDAAEAGSAVAPAVAPAVAVSHSKKQD